MATAPEPLTGELSRRFLEFRVNDCERLIRRGLDSTLTPFDVSTKSKRHPFFHGQYLIYSVCVSLHSSACVTLGVLTLLSPHQ